MKSFLALLVASALPAAAADRPKSSDSALPPISESVTVSVTNVDVVVTDSRGNRIHGLNKSDFQVMQDGVLQPITNFYAVSGGRTTLNDGTVVSVDAETEPDKPTDVPTVLQERFIIYVDNLMLAPLHRNRVFRSLRDFIEKQIGPGAEGMIVTFNRSLKVRQKFTTDHGILLGALDEIEGESGGAASLASERKDAIDRINDAKSPGEAMDIAKQTARSMDDDLRYAIDGLRNTINSFAGVEGRKVLVYLSDGLPETVAGELFDLIQQKFKASDAPMEAIEFQRTASYASIVQAANAQGVTVYAIDAAGLQVEEGTSAENAYQQNRISTFVTQQNYQAPLQLLARETGGIAAINTNDPTRELQELAKDFSDFYSLGYSSTRGATDRPHRIEVKILKPGLKVRSRSGFMEKSVETQTAESVTAALFYPRNDDPMKYSVAAGDPKPYDKQNYLVPVRLSIPLGNVTLIPDGEQYKGRLYIYFVVLDAAGNQSDLQIRPLDISIPLKKLDDARKKDFGYDVQLVMIPGGQKLSTAVRDSVSGGISFVQKSIFVSVLPAESKKN